MWRRFMDNSGNFGIEFQGAFVDLPSSQGGSDAKIAYHVAVADPTKFLISDAHLAGNPTLLGTTGSISVTETFLPLGAAGEHTMKIYADESVGSKLTDRDVLQSANQWTRRTKRHSGNCNTRKPNGNSVVCRSDFFADRSAGDDNDVAIADWTRRIGRLHATVGSEKTGISLT